MDEAGRCRRTDGKRWRCSKAVVPNEKYCDKHMHRGCRRSRKLVESSIIANPNLLNSVDPTCCPDLNISKVAWNVTKSETIKDNIGFGAKDPKIDNKSEDRRGNDRTTKITFKPEDKHDKKSSNGKAEEERLKKVTKRNTEGLEFCPKSVLGEGGVSFNQSSIQSVAAAADEVERRRCRRTDGKRWRCTKEVVAEDHKYCAKHMHRGSKKRLLLVPPLLQQGECNSFALVKRANKLVVGFDSN